MNGDVIFKKNNFMKAIIIEDENLIAKELQVKIKSIAPDVEIISILNSLKTAKKWLNNIF